MITEIEWSVGLISSILIYLEKWMWSVSRLFHATKWLSFFAGMARKDVYDFIHTVMKYSRRIQSSALFEETKLSGNPFSMLSSLRGAENVYTQHR